MVHLARLSCLGVNMGLILNTIVGRSYQQMIRQCYDMLQGVLTREFNYLDLFNYKLNMKCLSKPRGPLPSCNSQRFIKTQLHIQLIKY